jgi:hypothetical protein
MAEPMTLRYLADELLSRPGVRIHEMDLDAWFDDQLEDAKHAMIKEMEAAAQHNRAPVGILQRADRWFPDGMMALRYGYLCAPINDDIHRMGQRLIDKANASFDDVIDRVLYPILERAFGLSSDMPGSTLPDEPPGVYKVMVELCTIASNPCGAGKPHCDDCPLRGSCAFYEYKRGKP